MTRRTVYGRVSRYKLDEYLQLFDFPTPSISAEKRFTTTVPQQRLFLMNSDFMQVESEELAKRIAGEPDNRARIKKAYQLIYGRDPKEDEIKLGIAYLHEEPLKEYEENKNKPPEPGGGRGGRGGRDGMGGGTPPTQTDATKPGTAAPSSPADATKPAATTPAADGAAAPSAPPAPSDATKPAAADTSAAPPTPTPEAAAPDSPAPMGMGMMAGMGGRRGPGPGRPAEVKYEPTAWGRYIKVLFSSSEFFFVN
jgi:Protein of unknown function (DUF1553)